MNISSTVKTFAAQPLSKQAAPTQLPLLPEPEKKSFADSVSLASGYTAGGAGVVAGLVWGTKAAIGAAVLLEVSDATGLFLAGVAIGGSLGAFAGSGGVGIAEQVAGSLTKRLGVSEDLGRTIGATSVSALAGAAITGSATGALWGAAAALSGGGLVYATNR